MLVGQHFQAGFPVLRSELSRYGRVRRLLKQFPVTGGEIMLVFEILLPSGRKCVQQLRSCPKLHVREVSLYPCEAVYMHCAGVDRSFSRRVIMDTIAAILGNEIYEFYLFRGNEIAVSHFLFLPNKKREEGRANLAKQIRRDGNCLFRKNPI